VLFGKDGLFGVGIHWDIGVDGQLHKHPVDHEVKGVEVDV